MIAPLLVLLSHAVDLWTFLLALDRYGMIGESAPFANLIAAGSGLPGVVSVKVVGSLLLALLVWHRRRFLLPAAASGIVYATANVWALSL